MPDYPFSWLLGGSSGQSVPVVPSGLGAGSGVGGINPGLPSYSPLQAIAQGVFGKSSMTPEQASDYMKRAPIPVKGEKVLPGEERGNPSTGPYMENSAAADAAAAPPQMDPGMPIMPQKVSLGSGSSTTSTVSKSKVDTSGLDRAVQDVNAINAKAAQRDAEMARDKLNAQKRLDIAYQTKLASQRAEQAAEKKKYLAEEKRFQSLREGIDKAKINPDEYWEKLTGGSKLKATFISTMIAMDNSGQAQKMLDKNIDRNIQAQMADLKKKQGQAATSRNMLGFISSRVGDMDSGIAMTRSMMKEDLAASFDEIALKYQGTAAGMKAAQMAAKQRMDATKIKLDLAREERTTTTKQKTSSWSQHLVPQGRGAKAAEGDKDVQVLGETLEKIRYMKDNYKNNKWKVAAGLGEAGTIYDAYREQIAVMLWKAIDTGKLSDQDVKTAKRIMLPSRLSALSPLGHREAGLRMFNDAERHISGFQQKMNSSQAGRYRYSAAQKEKIKREIAKKYGVPISKLN